MSKERSVAILKLLQENGYDLQSVIELMEDVAKIPATAGAEVVNTTGQGLDNRVTKTLLEIGVPTNIRGFGYLRTAVVGAYNDPCMIQGIVKNLYPFVAEKHGTTASRAERSIRHAIERAFDNISQTVYKRYFGNTVSNIKGKPTNSEFISAIVEYLRMEDNL